MINVRLALAALLLASLTSAPGHAGSLARTRDNAAVLKTSRPTHFKPRKAPVVTAILVHYGSAVTETDLRRVGALLAERFNESTEGTLALSILDHRVIPLKPVKRDLDKIAAEIPGPPEKKDPARLTRLWYYYNVEGSIADEVRGEMRKAPGLKEVMKEADAVLVLAEPQFEGLGYADGAYAITEQPVEIAWGAEGGGTTRFETDARVADELLHELGHVLGLGHAASQCDPGKPDYRECCKASPNGNDVMSYCRMRSDVNETFYYGFQDCTRQFLVGTTVPRMLSGGARARQAQGCR